MSRNQHIQHGGLHKIQKIRPGPPVAGYRDEHARCELCKRCVDCNSFQCGSTPSKYRCRKHQKKKKA